MRCNQYKGPIYMHPYRKLLQKKSQVPTVDSLINSRLPETVSTISPYVNINVKMIVRTWPHNNDII